MEDYLDEMSLFALCCVLLIAHPFDPFAIAGLLAAVTMVCASNASAPVRIGVEVAFTTIACASSALFAFLPVAAYRLMHERPWAVRLAWVVPLILHGATFGMDALWVQGCAICIVACALAVRDARTVTERSGLTRAYDELRERTIALANREADGARAADAPNDSTSQPALFEDLTQREIAVAQLVAEGMDNREISQRLFLSEGTIRNHISAILSKKQLTNRTQIAVLYYTS